MDINIPTYRAKKINSDEYVTGFLNIAFDYGNYEEEDVEEPEKKYFLIQFMDNESSDIDMWSFNGFNEIDATTLVIHFPDMLDSQKNKIFASLNKDSSIGASKIEYIASGSTANYKTYGYLYYNQETFSFEFCSLGFHKDLKRHTPKDSFKPRFDMDFRARYKDTLKVIGIQQ